MGEILHTLGVSHRRRHLPHRPQHRTKNAVFFDIAAFSRVLDSITEMCPHSQGGRWGAGWGTSGRAVGTPGERGGDPRHLTPKFLVTCGEPRGGQSGPLSIPGKAMGGRRRPHRTRTGEALEHHRRRSFTTSRIPLLLHDHTRPSAPLSTRTQPTLISMTPVSRRAQPTPTPTTPTSTRVLTTLKPMTPPSTRAQPTPTPTTPPSTRSQASMKPLAPASTRAQPTPKPMTPPSTRAQPTPKPTTPPSTRAQPTPTPTTPPLTRVQPTPTPMAPPSTRVLTTLKPTTPPSTRVLTTLKPTTPPSTRAQPTPKPMTPPSTRSQASMKPLAPPIATTGVFWAFFARRRCLWFHSTSIALRQRCCRFQSPASHAHTARRAPPGRPHTVNSQHTIHVRPRSAPTPHARLCVSWLLGGRMCVMVAQHSWCFVSVLRVS